LGRFLFALNLSGRRATPRNYPVKNVLTLEEFKKLSFEGDSMKKLFTLLCTLALGATLSFAQAGGGTTGSTGTGTSTTDTGKKGHKSGKKGHKGGKKSKKGSTSTTPPPK